MRSTAAMNSRVMSAVTIPSSTHTRKVAQVNAVTRGRTMTSISTPAHARRIHAAPSTPMRSISETAIARPTWTHSIDPIAIKAPERAWFVITPALNGTTTVRVHLIFLDISFANHEQSAHGYPSPAVVAVAVAAGFDARRRRDAPSDHVDGVATDRCSRKGNRRATD